MALQRRAICIICAAKHNYSESTGLARFAKVTLSD